MMKKAALSAYSPFAFASKPLEAAYQEARAHRVQTVVFFGSLFSLVISAIITYRICTDPTVLGPQLPLLIIIPVVVAAAVLVQALLWCLPSLFRAYWQQMNVGMRLLIIIFQFVGTSQMPIHVPTRPLSFWGWQLLLSNVSAMVTLVAMPESYPLPLVPQALTLLLQLAVLISLNGDLCHRRLANMPGLPAHFREASEYVRPVAAAMTLAPVFGGQLAKTAPLPCEVLVGIWEVGMAGLGMALHLVLDVMSRRAYLIANPGKLGEFAFLARTWPFGHPKGINICIICFISVVVTTCVTLRVVLLLSSGI